MISFRHIAPCFLFGISISMLTEPRIWHVLLPLFAGAVLYLNRKPHLCTLVLCVAAGMARHAQEPAAEKRYSIPHNCLVAVEGRVVNVPYSNDRGLRLSVESTGISKCIERRQLPELHPAGAVIHLFLQDAKAMDIHKGDTIAFTARLRILQRYNNRSFSRPDRMPSAYTAGIRHPGAIAVLERGSFAEPSLDRLRGRISHFWKEETPGRVSQLAQALAVGQSRALGSELKEKFRATGTSHLLAISGLHLGIVAFLLLGMTGFVLRRLPPISRRYDTNRISAMLTIAGLVGFTLLTGSNPPVLRACIMGCMFLVARIIYRKVHATDTLGLCAVVFSMHQPLCILQPGVQLSFITVCSLIVVFQQRKKMSLPWKPSPPGTPEFPLWRRVLQGGARRTTTLAISCVVAHAATAPILAWHFGEVCAAAPLINIIAVPFVSFVLLPLVLLTSILAVSISWAARITVKPAAVAADMFLDGIDSPIAQGLSFNVESPLLLSVTTLCSLGIMALVCRRKKTASLAFVIAAICSCLWFYLAQQQAHNSSGMVVDFLDVGQGDSTLLRFPDGKYWLIDGGGTARSRIGSEHIVPVLEDLGVAKLEKVILTHPDPDHVNGLPDVVARFMPGEIWDNGQGLEEDADPAYGRMLDVAGSLAIPVRRGSEICGRFTKAGVEVRVLHPCFNKQTYDPLLSFNDNSIVISLTYNNKSVLLAGDLSHEGEQVLLEQGLPDKADVLKLGHHGSGTSSSDRFLARVRPQIAVTSCALGNQYNFPSDDVLLRLEEFNSKHLGTHVNGRVRISFGENGIGIETSKKP